MSRRPQVAEAITGCPGVSEAVVYGVAVPGADGRAGMAAIVVAAGFDFAASAPASRRRAAGLRAAAFVRLRATHRCDRHLQAEEAGSRHARATIPRATGRRRSISTTAAPGPSCGSTAALYDSIARRQACGCEAGASGGVAGIDGHHRAGDVSGLLAHQEFDRIGDVVDFGEAVERAAAGDLVALAGVRLWVISVAIKPGATALTVIPSFPTSRASERVKPSSEALVAL